jgi:transposase
MDNASFHKPEKIQHLIEDAGCLLEYLPSYSPDLNPIEHKWAQAKALRRKLGCSTDELFQQSVLWSFYCALAIFTCQRGSFSMVSSLNAAPRRDRRPETNTFVSITI